MSYKSSSGFKVQGSEFYLRDLSVLENILYFISTFTSVSYIYSNYFDNMFLLILILTPDFWKWAFDV